MGANLEDTALGPPAHMICPALVRGVMQKLEAWRWGAVIALVVVSLIGMVVAVAYDVACELDCAPDDDVTWLDALTGPGTGLSPPAFLLVVLVALAWLGGRSRWQGTVGLVGQLLVAAVMTFASFADAGTTDSMVGAHGPPAAIVAAALILAVLATGITAGLALSARRRGR